MKVGEPEPITYVSLAFCLLSIVSSAFEAASLCFADEPIAEKIDPSFAYFQLEFSPISKKEIILRFHERTHKIFLKAIRDRSGKIENSKIEVCNVQKRWNSLIVQFVAKVPCDVGLDASQIVSKDPTSNEYV